MIDAFNKLVRSETGISALLAALIIAVIAVTGVIAIRTSSAHYRKPAYGPVAPLSQSGSQTAGCRATVGAKPDGSRIVERLNGTGNCNVSLPGQSGGPASNICIINGQTVPVENGQCSYSGSSTAGTPGKSTCTANGKTVESAGGSCSVTSTSGPGGTVSRCTVNGQEVPCQ